LMDFWFGLCVYTGKFLKNSTYAKILTDSYLIDYRSNANTGTK
jgi:hypothetical protein